MLLAVLFGERGKERGSFFTPKHSSRCFVAHLRARPWGEGGTLSMKGAGMLVGNFELNP